MAVLYGTGVYLLLQRTLTRIILGLALLSHGGNLLLMIVGGRAGVAPFIGAITGGQTVADPLPQALALTAIVISFGITAFLLALAYRSWQLTHDDEVEDDVEDRRIAHHAIHGPTPAVPCRRPPPAGRPRPRADGGRAVRVLVPLPVVAPLLFAALTVLAHRWRPVQRALAVTGVVDRPRRVHRRAGGRRPPRRHRR